jgi:fumarylacetoacetate (FAA) hydrolase family protein
VTSETVKGSTPYLGTLANRVNASDRVAPWTCGTATLMRDLAHCGLLH